MKADPRSFDRRMMDALDAMDEDEIAAPVGTKHDDGKPMFALIPPRAELEVVKALTHGANKYGPYNWRTIDDPRNRYTSAAGRHQNARRRGVVVDADSGVHNIALAIASLMFLLEVELEEADDAILGREHFVEKTR